MNEQKQNWTNDGAVLWLWRWFWIAVALNLIACAIVNGDEIDLELKGPGVKVVKVDKVVIVKEDATVVTSFPFSVSAPTGGVAYFWRYPDSVSAIEKGNVLEITKANKGPLTISVQFFVVDFDAKKVTNKFGNSTVNVGDVPTPPDPPDPPDPPVPPTEFEQSVMNGWIADLKPAGFGKRLRDVYSSVLSNFRADPDITYAGAFQTIKLASDDQVGNRLPNTRRSIGLELVKHFPSDGTKKIDINLVAEHLNRVITALDKLEN